MLVVVISKSEEDVQSSSQEHQSDLEVILEFLEEHYRQESQGKAPWSTRDFHISGEDRSHELNLHGTEQDKPQEELLPASKAQRDMGSPAKANRCDHGTTCSVNHSPLHHSSPKLNTLKGGLSPNPTTEECAKSLCSVTPAEKGKKLRLFHFLFEMLEDPDMGHCVSWVPASVGVFRFSAKHKERVAELWGQRKGNRMPMTYQKMSRALRNYGRSGEIIKVKKKLTYRFSAATLSALQTQALSVKK
ncbi:hypothetical protein DNTS_017656 [Danionella cerebrum]|uniref:Transcription factor Spi-C n=1 Tax=Danionella cerebrum TaxID=2873325 RepID=A0A553MXF3_9TELE|nr:hypothetical protein DNTS_017656 [Danionella translucida]